MILKVLIALIWALSSAAVIFLITLPISLQSHLIAGTVVVLVMVVLKMLGAGGVWRMISLCLGTAIVLRYVYWRTTSTLPPVNELEDFIPGLLLYLAEMYSVFMLFLSLFVVARPLPSGQVAPPTKVFPHVDVFVPTYNEEASLLTSTLAAAQAMDYPKDRFTVWLLDDGGTVQKCESMNAEEAEAARERRAELQALCETMGARYLTRERNVHAKAGNLNHALEHSTGELIAVFDADHAPARDFLNATVGYFEHDPKLFLVQTPHFFINPDPVERNLRTFHVMPSENEMFYGIIQRGLDKWNAAFFCGSAAVLSREALKVTNGFSGLSITEDCETALELHSRGYNSIYVDRPLIAGLQPATFASFIGQRTRWAQGMMQINLFRFPPAKRGLTIAQRLCYMSSTLFWLFPFARMTFLIAPFFYLFFSLEIFTASGPEFLAYTSTYILVNLMMQNYLYGSFRWPWVSELYEFIQSVYLMPALISVMLNPRKPTFKVTSKNEDLQTAHISELGRPFYIIFALLLVGVGVTVWRVVAHPYEADVTLVVGAWNILNLIMAGCALGVVSERTDPRHSHRVTVMRRAEFLIGDTVVPATIEDVSYGGAKIRFGNAKRLQGLASGSIGTIRFQPHGQQGLHELPLRVRTMVHEEGGLFIGAQFMPGTAQHHRLIADLIFANSDQWTAFQKSRRRNPGILRGTVWFMSTALWQTGRGIVYLFRAMRPRTAESGATAPSGH
jgi:cellulose synthase (UDP-forming)